MTDPQQALARLMTTALAAAFGPDYADADPLIRPSQFADYQSNVALPLVKRLGPSAIGAMNKIFGFLILAIAVQLIWNGMADFRGN